MIKEEKIVGELYICADAKFNHQDYLYNEYVIKKWNSFIKDEDTVLILGDFADNSETLLNIIPQLNGRIEFIDWDKQRFPDLNEEELDKLTTGRIYCNGIVRGEINERDTYVIIAIDQGAFPNRNSDLELYYAAPQSLIHSKERYKDRTLNLSIEHWGYTPILYNQIPVLINNCILFDQMKIEEIDLNQEERK